MTAEDPNARATTGRAEAARTDDELTAVVHDLWAQVEQRIHDNGTPSRKKISTATGLPYTTLCDWLSKRATVPDWEQFSRIISFLGDDPRGWGSRWKQARAAADILRSRKTARARKSGRSTQSPPRSASPSGNPGSAGSPDDRPLGPVRTASGDVTPGGSPASAQPVNADLSPNFPPPGSASRRRRTVAAVAALVVAVAITVWIAYPTIGGSDATVPLLIGKHPDQACAQLKAADLVCAPDDNQATRQTNIVHAQNQPAGTVLPTGSPVRYTYESTAPLPLTRHQAPPPDSANVLSISQPAPPRWSPQPSPGWAYSAGVNDVPGLIPIYQYRCTKGCQEKLIYYLSRIAGPKRGWTYERETFRCFNPDTPPPAGTRPLHALFNKKHARTWAVPGTPQHQIATTHGFTDPPPTKPLCYIW